MPRHQDIRTDWDAKFGVVWPLDAIAGLLAPEYELRRRRNPTERAP